MFRIVTNAKPSLYASSTQSLSYTRLNMGESEEDFGEYEPEPPKLERKLSRTSMLIEEYRRFLAARTIQRRWRGYFVRHKLDRRTWAAIVIQKWWRRFAAQRNLYKMIENRLQKTIMEHYNRSATKIQALWRGYWIRQTVHDMDSLKRLQTMAAEDLLHCVAFKLHHLLRTFSIPGVYSLRNSHCLSKVEKLLASMNFRFHNDRVRAARAQREAIVKGARKQFANSAYATEAPYAGPNYAGACSPQCEEFVRSHDADRRMFKIIAMYEESMQGDKHAKQIKMSLAEKRRRKKIEEILNRQGRLRSDFCSDVINSMKKWHILDQRRLTVNKDVFRTPENVENFLKEIQSYLDLMNVPCHCKQANIESAICH